MRAETVGTEDSGLGEVEAGSAPPRRGAIGLRGKLTFAFGAVAAAGLVSAGVAMVQFASIRQELDTVTGQSLPAISAAQEVATESARLAASAPLLDGAATQSARERVFGDLKGRFEALQAQIARLGSLGVDAETVSALDIKSRQMLSTIEAQDGLVRQRLEAAQEREAALAGMTAAHEALVDALEPQIVATTDSFREAADGLAATTDAGIRSLSEDTIARLILLYEVREGVVQLARTVTQVMDAIEVERIDEIWRDAVPVTARLHSAIQKLSADPAMAGVVAPAEEMLGLSVGDESAFETRKQAIDPEASAMTRIGAAGEAERQVGLAATLEARLEEAIVPAIRTAQVNIKLAGIDLKSNSDRAMNGLVQVQLPRFASLLELSARSNRLAGLLAGAASAPDNDALARAILDLTQETADLEAARAAIAEAAPEVAEAAGALMAFAGGEAGLAAIRMKELEAESTSAIQLAGTRQRAEELGMTVTNVVDSVEAAGLASARAAEAALDQARTWLLTAAGIGVLVALGFALVYVPRRITNRMLRLGSAMRDIAAGKLDTEIPADGRDEIAGMAAALVVFRDNAREIEAANARAEEERHRAAEERRISRLQLADSFEASVQSVVDNVGSSASRMHDSATRMSGIAGTTSQQVRDTAQTSDQAAGNVQVVASTAEELASSIAEIARQVSDSTRIAGEAVNEAEQTTLRVRSLAEASEKIGAVVSLIQSIAAQTNLLALNATIEAARAGDAGRGFAVVANEVKSLANQTAKATDEIGGQIADMQRATNDAVSAIDGIGHTIAKISDIAGSIAAAVEEQGAATSEIARSVQEVAAGTSQVSTNMGSVAQATDETGGVAQHVLDAAAQMSGEAERLNSEVARFLAQLRAA